MDVEDVGEQIRLGEATRQQGDCMAGREGRLDDMATEEDSAAENQGTQAASLPGAGGQGAAAAPGRLGVDATRSGCQKNVATRIGRQKNVAMGIGDAGVIRGAGRALPYPLPWSSSCASVGAGGGEGWRLPPVDGLRCGDREDPDPVRRGRGCDPITANGGILDRSCAAQVPMSTPPVPPAAPSAAAPSAAAPLPAASPDRMPPGATYGGHAAWETMVERVFPRAWMLVATTTDLPVPGAVLPLVLLPGVLDEPVLLVRGEGGEIHAYSNVCTHRGAVLVEAPGCLTSLRCPYHGRRFGLDGRLRHAPEFERCPEVAGEHLPEVAVGVWGPFVFVALDPAVPFETLFAPIEARCGFLATAALTRDPAGEAVYEVEGSWALWCENYLEGLHVPWVHPGLAASLDWRRYHTEVAPWSVIQIGVGAGGVALPPGHPDTGREVAAFYFHLLPLTTLNFYPWGLSVNVVEPAGPTRTRIRYQTWVRHPERRGTGAGGALDEVEREDDAIVARVQRGVRARLYRGGRYAPGWEDGVRHFHRLLADLGVSSGSAPR